MFNKESLKCSPTDFSSGFYTSNTIGNDAYTVATEVMNNAVVNTSTNSNNPITGLNLIRIQYASSVYPQPDYNLNFTNFNPNVGLTSVGSSNTSNDLFRAFYDFLVNSDSLRDRAGSLLNFEGWQIAPIFIFKTHQPRC